MKRKAILELLQTKKLEELHAKIERIIPAGLASEKLVTSSRLILQNSIKKSQKENLSDAAEVYARICSDSGSLKAFLAGTPTAKMTKAALSQSQALLTEVLTSKAGRKKTSDQSRQEQLAAAQARRRDKIKQEGRKQLNIFISPEAAEYLETIKERLGCSSQAEALEQVLKAAMKAKLLNKKAQLLS